MSTATWIRKFVMEHRDYQHDSVVSDVIAYDLMVACREIGEGERVCPELLGDIRISR
jgi:glutamate--cysteine ligase catalytic subunit